MKPKFKQKLVLRKTTIVNLDASDKKKVVGGYFTHTCGYGGASCPGDATCDGAYTCNAGCTAQTVCYCPQETDDCPHTMEATCVLVCG
jgi:hypothetical protein